MFMLSGSLSSCATMAQTSSTGGEHGATELAETEVVYSDETNVIHLN